MVAKFHIQGEDVSYQKVAEEVLVATIMRKIKNNDETKLGHAELRTSHRRSELGGSWFLVIHNISKLIEERGLKFFIEKAEERLDQEDWQA